MNVNIAVKSDLDKAANYVAAMSKQMRFATANAINSTAFDARTSLGNATRQYFNNPTSFTQKGFQVEKANKATLLGIVGAESKRGRYLRTQIKGGDRPQKGFERRFLSDIVGTGSVPGNTQLVATSLVKLNAEGNVSLATIKRIQKGLSGPSRGGFFAGVPKHSNLPFGIYRRSRYQLFPYFVASNGPATYKPRYPMEDIVTKVIQRRFDFYFQSSLEKAIASAR